LRLLKIKKSERLSDLIISANSTIFDETQYTLSVTIALIVYE